MGKNQNDIPSTWDGETVVDAVAFDMDGVLVDSYRIWFRVLNATLEELGREPLSEDAFRPHWGQPVEKDLEAWFPGFTVEEVEAAYARRFPEHVHHVRVLPEATDLLDRLEATGVPRAVVTNSPRDMAEALLSGGGLRRYFEHVLTASDVPRSKPAPDLVLAAGRLLGAPPERLLVVGDSRYDAAAARNAGAPFWFFRGFGDLRRLLEGAGLLDSDQGVGRD